MPSIGQTSSASPWTRNFGFSLASVAGNSYFIPEIDVATGGAMPIERRHPIVERTDFERDPGSEGEARRPQRNARIARRHVVERRREVRLLAVALIERAVAPADAAEVEAQHGAAEARQPLGALEHRLRVHRAAELRMRVGEDDRGADGRRIGAARRRRGKVENGLEPAGGAGEISDGWHGRSR